MIRDRLLRCCLLSASGRRVRALLLPLCLLLLVPMAAQAATASPRELLSAGRADDALRLLTPQTAGNDAATFNYIGRVYFALGDWDNAVQNCERATQLDPGNAIYQLWLGRSYGEKAEAANLLLAYPLARRTVAAFITAHALDPHNLAIIHDLAEYYTSAPAIVGGSSEKALALASEVAAEFPADAARIRAEAAADQGDYERAESEYGQAIRLDHESARAYMYFAHYLCGRKNWQRCQQTVERAVKSSGIQPTDRYDAAELLLRLKRNLSLAAQQLRDYIQSGHPEEEAPLFRAHFLLGEILRKSGDDRQAAAEYNAALALASTYRPATESLRHVSGR